MIEEQYDMLLELQKIDIDIDEEEKKKRNLPLMIEGITKKIQGLKDSLKNKNENYKNLQIKLKRKELDLAEKSNKINKHQEDLYGGKISDIKELKQIQKVIANYKEEKDSIEEDAEKTLDIKAEGTDVLAGDVKAEAYRSVSAQIMKRFPKAKKVITTLRGSVSASHNTWSGVLYDGKTLFKAPEYNITHIVDRIGGGDAFMAGLIYGMITGLDDQKALDFATAASCLKHTIPGDFNLATLEEVETLMSGDKSGRVKR